MLVETISISSSVGYTMSSVNPDYVVVGESTSHNYEKIAKAVDLVLKGILKMTTYGRRQTHWDKSCKTKRD